MDPSAWMERLRQDDHQALEQLLTHYDGMLRYIISGMLSDPRTGRTAWPRSAPSCGRGGTSTTGRRPAPPPGSPPCAATPPMTTCALSAAGAIGRNWTPAAPTGPRTGGAQVLRQERIQRLQEAVNPAVRRDRTLFYRKYYYLQSTARIAAELGTTERAVEGKLYRIRQTPCKRC